MDEFFEELPNTFARMTRRWLQDVDPFSGMVGNSGMARNSGINLWNDMMRVRTEMETLPDAYVVRADLPGLSKEDVHMEVDTQERRLILSGERKYQRHNEGGSTDGSQSSTYYSERQYGSFNRSILLPEDANLEIDVAAKMKDGVLEVRIARTAPPVSKAKRAIKID